MAQSATGLQVDPHGVIERLEQVAMLAPDTFAVEAPDHQHALIPCLAFAAGSLLLLLCVGLFLRRERFGEAPRHAPSLSCHHAVAWSRRHPIWPGSASCGRDRPAAPPSPCMRAAPLPCSRVPRKDAAMRLSLRGAAACLALVALTSCGTAETPVAETTTASPHPPAPRLP